MRKMYFLLFLIIVPTILPAQPVHPLVEAQKQLIDIKESMVRGEFEKTEEFNERVDTLQQRFDTIINKDYYDRVPISFGSYNADSEILPVFVNFRNLSQIYLLNDIEQLTLKIPPDEAKTLKEGKKNVSATGKFWIEPDRHVFLDGQLEIQYKSKKYKTNPSDDKIRIRRQRMFNLPQNYGAYYLNGDKFVFATKEKISIYSLNNFEKIGEFTDIDLPICLSRNGNYIAAHNSYRDKFLKEDIDGTVIIDLNDDEEICHIPQKLFGMLFLPNNKYLASANGPTITLWNISNGSKHFSLQQSGLVLYAISENGKYLATASESYVTIWDTESGQKVNSIHNGLYSGNGSIAISEKGIIVIGDPAGSNLFNFRTGKGLEFPDYVMSSKDFKAHFYNNGQLLVVGGYKNLHFINMGNLDLIKKLDARPPFSVDFGESILFCKEAFHGITVPQLVEIYDISNWKKIRTIDFNDPEYIYYSPNENVLLLRRKGSKGDIIILYKIEVI